MVISFNIGDTFTVKSRDISVIVKCVSDDTKEYGTNPCNHCIFYGKIFDCFSIDCKGCHFVLETYNQQVIKSLEDNERH